MKKNSIKEYAILTIVFALISVVAFVIPATKTATFWIAYAFTAVAFAAQILIWKISLGKSGMLKSKFLGFSVVTVGIIYLIFQIVAFVVFMFATMLPIWSAIIICSIIASVSALCIITADECIDDIMHIETKVNGKVFYIRELQVDVELLAEDEKDMETKVALGQLAEKIRFSDPMSNDSLTDLENRIASKVAQLKISENKTEIILEINSLLNERNKKCKIMK